MMYAVFEDGSRQYRVSEGDRIRVDWRDKEIGALLEFNRVLLYHGESGLQIGQPLVEGARITADIVDQKSVKTYIQHFRRRKNYRRLKGHRQWQVEVEIRNILLAGEEPRASAGASLLEKHPAEASTTASSAPPA